MTSWLLNFPNINLNIAEPIDEFVRYININYGEVFVAAKKMLSIFINGINGALDMIPWWLMILLVVLPQKTYEQLQKRHHLRRPAVYDRCLRVLAYDE